MATRALGAVFALVAGLAFVTAFAGGAAPTAVPGWWDGHPRIEGRVFERKDLHIGLVTAYGCNRGETIKCQPLITETARVSVGYIELGALALVAITAFALMRSAWAIGDRRKLLGKALLVQAAIAALGGVIVLALGPQIRVAQRFEVPIGVGFASLWTGVACAMVAAVIAMRLKPEPLRLRSSQTHKVPPEPMPVPAPLPARTAPDPVPKSEPPTLPRLPGASPSRPPPIPAAAVPRAPAPPAASGAIPSGADGAAAPALPGGGVAPRTDGEPSFGRGTIPPPLSAISFWSQPIEPGIAGVAVHAPVAPPPPLSPAVETTAPAALSLGSPAVESSPSLAIPPPIPPASPAVESSGSSAIPPPIPPGPPVIPPPTPNVPSVPRPMPPSLPTIIHAVPPPPGAAVEPPAPSTPPTEAADSSGEAIASPGSSDGNQVDSSEGPISATLVAVTPAPPAGSDDTGTETNVAAAEATSPHVEVPISTAPASLPPPKKAAPTTSELAPACPQCEAGMTWVDEHLRFYCGECRMYF